jgi:hypothetical protein
MSNQQGEGLRFNQGKSRYDLIPAFAQEQYARVLTKGAEKYAERNWERGMPWSKVLASLERHLYAIKRGEDVDPETGLLHSAHVMTNAAFLTEYYKIFPQGDDRPTFLTKPSRIGIDIDDVLADFIGAYCERFRNGEAPSFWEFDKDFMTRYESIGQDREFWTSLKTIVAPQDMAFEPVAYITSRPESLREFTEQWLFEVNKYPAAPVFFASDKLETIKKLNIDKFIDDKTSTFKALNKAGVLCYLFSSSHNQYVNAGFRRITKETINSIL